MSNVIKWIGDTTLDTPPDDVLEAAKGETGKCLVIGWQEDGGLWFSGSFSDVAEINYLLDVAKTEVMSWGREDGS